MSKNVKLNVIFKSSKRIKNAFRFKDILPKHISPKVLYKFKSDTCNRAYIGETKQYLLARQYEHLGLSVLTEKLLKADSRDLTIFKFFGVIFSLKKKTNQFPLSFDLYFPQKRAPKLSICHLPTKRYV